MSTTITYKGSTIATVDNNTKTLNTAGKYLEADIVLTDVSGGEETWDVIFDGNATIEESDVNYVMISSNDTVSVGDVYRVTWNGVTTTLTAKEADINGTIFIIIGNPVSESLDYDDGSGITYYGYKFNDSNFVFGTADAAGDITLKIEKQVASSYYMWLDENYNNDLNHYKRYIRFSESEHSGYKINVSSIEAFVPQLQPYQTTISDWSFISNNGAQFYESEEVVDNLNNILEINTGTYKITYDNTIYYYTLESASSPLLGQDLYEWDGESELEYPFTIYIDQDYNEIFYDVLTDTTHTFTIEYEGE